jgi:hypothetical protein
MPSLQKAKNERYRKNLQWVKRRWKDAKMWYSAGSKERLRDNRLFQSVAESADTSVAYVKQVYHHKDTSERLLRYLCGAVKGLRKQMGVPEWL